MSLEVYPFPDKLVEAVAGIPLDRLVPGSYSELGKHLESLELTTPDFISDEPVVVRLEEDQATHFDSSFTEPTPTQLPAPDTQPVSRFGLLQLALGASIGKLLRIPEVRDGAMLQDIFPKEGSRTKADSSYGSEGEFAFHNDLSFLDHEAIPRFVTLGCIRNKEKAATSAVSVANIISNLSGDEIGELQKSQFSIRHTYNRGKSDEYTGERLSPVLLPEGEICLGVDMTPQTEGAALAMKSLGQLISELSTPHVLQPGEVLVLPNMQAVHNRDTFVMSAEPGRRRWLQRLNIG